MFTEEDDMTTTFVEVLLSDVCEGGMLFGHTFSECVGDDEVGYPDDATPGADWNDLRSSDFIPIEEIADERPGPEDLVEFGQVQKSALSPSMHSSLVWWKKHGTRSATAVRYF